MFDDCFDSRASDMRHISELLERGELSDAVDWHIDYIDSSDDSFYQQEWESFWAPRLHLSIHHTRHCGVCGRELPKRFTPRWKCDTKWNRRYACRDCANEMGARRSKQRRQLRAAQRAALKRTGEG